MKRTPSKSLLYIVLAIIGIFLTLHFCDRNIPGCSRIDIPADTIVIRDTVWQYDTTIYVQKVPVPVPVEIIPADPSIIPSVPDSVCCAQLYASAVYVDTLMNDSNALIVLHDTVCLNRLGNRTLEYKNNRPTQVIHNSTQIINPYPSGFYPGVGLTVPLSADESLGISVGLTYFPQQSHGKNVFSAGYDVVNKRVSMCYSIRLFK